MKILVAEDDAFSRLLIASALKKLGHEVVVTVNGRDAWRCYQQEYYPLLISDWMMPELDGLGLCRLVRAENRIRYTYVMLLTMLEGKGCFLEGMKAGADDFITKPFDEEQLAARLHVAERIVNLQKEIKQLQGLLPICSYCKKIRDGAKEWMPLEDYLARRTETAFSHGICSACYTSCVQPQLAGLTAPSRVS